MGYAERLQRTIDFVEANIKQELGVARLSAVACFSPFHFSRVFQAFTGQTIMDYVRARRLSASISDLKNHERCILDIAVDHGFGGRDSYTRAFKRRYGITPDECRRRRIYPLPGLKVELAEIEKKIRRLGMISGLTMKVVEMPEAKIAGYELRTNGERGFQEIPRFWQTLMKDKRLWTIRPLLPVPAVYQKVELGLCTAADPTTGDFSYVIGWFVETTEGLPNGLFVTGLPAAHYAVFTTPPTARSSFTTVIQLVTRYIYHDWLPHSEYEYDEKSCDLEWYDERCHGEHAISMDICVPVRAKSASS